MRAVFPKRRTSLSKEVPAFLHQFLDGSPDLVETIVHLPLGKIGVMGQNSFEIRHVLSENQLSMTAFGQAYILHPIQLPFYR